jgi:ferric-dicitrate binding protein FerR (iron transport regulator)
MSDEPNDEGGREAAALFLRLGRACWFHPLCKNSDAARGRALPRVERADAQTKPMHATRDAAEVLARSGRRRATYHHATSTCVMGGLWTEHKKRMSNRQEYDYGTNVRARR